MVEIDASLYLWEFVNTALEMSYSSLCDTKIYKDICEQHWDFPNAEYTIACEVFIPFHIMEEAAHHEGCAVHAKDYATFFNYDRYRDVYIFRTRESMYVGMFKMAEVVLEYIKHSALQRVPCMTTVALSDQLTNYMRFYDRVNQVVDVIDLANSMDSLVVTRNSS